jgi:2'-5' RNA ligase
MIRIFVGLPISVDISARLKIMCNSLPGVRWVDPTNMHITLRFIGELDERDAEEAHFRLSDVNVDPFNIELHGIGTFGQDQKTRALWVGVKSPSTLAYLRAKVESAIVRLGQLPEKRKFRPHVTLARFSRVELPRLESFVAGNNIFQAGLFRVDQFNLFESPFGKGGPVYTPLKTYALS